MPLSPTTFPGLKYDPSNEEYNLAKTVNFPLTSTSLDLPKSQCRFFVSNSNVQLSCKLKNAVPSVAEKSLDIRVDSFKFSQTGANSDRTQVELNANALGNGIIQASARYPTAVGNWAFRLKDGSMQCRDDFFSFSTPTKWELTVEGVANVSQEYRIQDLKVIGARQAPIPDVPATPTPEELATAVNSILATMRTHGLIDP